MNIGTRKIPNAKSLTSCARVNGSTQGQNAVQTLIAETMAKCSEILDTALAVAEADIGFSNPWWDIASSRHETADFRLFIS